MRRINPLDIDALLPQTQCGQCGYTGCFPYAQAIAFNQAPIHLCPPGGVTTLQNLAALTGQEPVPFIAEMEKNAKEKVRVMIREAECIGCTKCIQACPVDAILGSPNHMHTVIAEECTGCELCIPACPVDCIETQSVSALTEDPIAKANHFRERFQARQQRLLKQKNDKTRHYPIPNTLDEKKTYIQQALMRNKAKKNTSST